MKDRVTLGYGPTKLTLTHSTGTMVTSWITLGLFKGNQVNFCAIFSGTSNGQNVKLQGALLTTESTKYIKTLATRLSSQTGTAVFSTRNNVFSRVRLYSTQLKAGSNVRGYFAAVV